MEIPIQVAVRIYPSERNTVTLPLIGSERKNAEHKTSKQIQDEEDAGEPAVETIAITAGAASDGGGCCVQAIPMAAGNLVPSGQASMCGQLGSGIASGIVQVGQHSFPVTHSLQMGCTQSEIYHQTVFPLMSLFTEGYDASVVTYGQHGTGKTYTLFGPGFHCVYGEPDQGVVARCVREIFAHMSNHPERTYAVNIGWVEICGEVIRDLLGIGNVHCQSITEVFHWMQLGMAAKAELNADASHSLFTLTLEQQWISKDGLIQHRLSTASFSDLCGTDRLFMLNAAEQATSVPKDLGLQSLEQIVSMLTDPALMYRANETIPYNQTTLTTLLKDSFGGRAQTLLILCISPLERDINETIYNLQFAFKAQCVRNYVIMNTFSDDNTPISPDVIVPEMAAGDIVGGGNAVLPNANDTCELQFAASQWFKLVANAEGLFTKLISSNVICELDKEQIEEWLFLKQECEECLSSTEAIRSQKQLGPIEEADEPDETVSEAETSYQENSNNESDSESQRPDLDEKLETLMEELRIKTDNLVQEKYNEFLKKQPNAVMESGENFQHSPRGDEEKTAPPPSAAIIVEKTSLDDRRISVGGRRRSIQPGASLSSAEIAMLNRVASREQREHQTKGGGGGVDDFMDSSLELQQHGGKMMRATINSPLDGIQKKVRKLDLDIEAHQQQIKEVEQTIQLKQNIITELVKNNDTRTTAKQRFNKKKGKLEAEHEKAKKQLAKAIVQGRDKVEIERLRALIEHLEQRLKDLVSIKHIAGESGQKVKKLQQSVHESKKLVDELQKKVKKERKLREHLECEMRSMREKENAKALLVANNNVEVENVEHGKNLKEMQARISHLDHVLKEKSDNLEQFGEGEEKESLRHEIRNLRRTRDHLLDQRCTLDRKLKRDKMLSHREERKLLECDEAIEAIDATIEFKNELICGHRSIDTSDRLQREKGEQMLMARLNKLSPEEMRTLLYKYFTKVIDLRESSRKLEMQLMTLEREKDTWEWRERVLSDAVRQARIEGERKTVLLQRQHEMKLTLMLRHLSEETSASSSSFNEHQRFIRTTTTATAAAAAPPPPPPSLPPPPLPPHHHHHHHHHHQHQHQHHPHHMVSSSASSSTALAHYHGNDAAPPPYLDSDSETDFYMNPLPAINNTTTTTTTTTTIATTTTTATATTKMLKSKHGGGGGTLEICPALPDALVKYKPLDKFKDKERETKNKLFAKFQVLTRYGSQSLSMGHSGHEDAAGLCLSGGGGGGGTVKKKDKHHHHQHSMSPPPSALPLPCIAAIPQGNLKRLISEASSTKVTRQKNKIIIQDASRKN